MRRRLFCSALALASLASLAPALLAGCSKHDGGATASGATKVTVALDWVPEPEFGGFYAARANGAYTKAGLDVEIRGGGAGAPVVQMVAAGQVEFGVVGGDEILIARARGADVVPIFAVYQTSPQAIMAHASRGAKSIADVIGSGTIAMEPGLPYAAFLAKKYGAFHAKTVPYDGGVARFVADKDYAQQCYVTSEPLAAKKNGSDPQIFLVADEGFNPYAAVVITRKALATEKPSRVKAFVAATREGWRAYLDDPTAANAVMAKLNPAMDATTFAAAAAAQKPLIETDETKQKGLGTMSRARWRQLGKQLAELGVVEKAPAVDDYLLEAE